MSKEVAVVLLAVGLLVFFWAGPQADQYQTLHNLDIFGIAPGLGGQAALYRVLQVGGLVAAVIGGIQLMRSFNKPPTAGGQG